MLTTMLLMAAMQAAPTPPAPPVPPAPPSVEKKVVREIVIRDGDKEEVIRLPEGDGERRRIVIRQMDGKGDKREFKILHREGGPGERAAHLVHCEGGRRFETEAEGAGEKGEKNRTRIVLCTKDAKGGASHADALERAAKRIADDKAMPEEVRARVLASLNAEIARLKGSR